MQITLKIRCTCQCLVINYFLTVDLENETHLSLCLQVYIKEKSFYSMIF